MAKRQIKIVTQQAKTYGLPIGGVRINLAEVVRSFHDFLAEKRYVLRDGQASPLREAQSDLLKVRAARQRLALERDAGKFVRRDDVRTVLMTVASIFREAGLTLERAYGNDAKSIIDEAIDRIEKDLLQRFAK